MWCKCYAPHGASFDEPTGGTPACRGPLLDPHESFFLLGPSRKELALAHWLVNGADGDKGRLFARCFGGDGIVWENAAGDMLASLTTMLWNAPSKSWTGGAIM